MKTRLLALKSAVPPFPIDQTAAAERAGQLFKNVRDIDRFMPVFTNTGIEKRYSCVPIDWYNDTHGWKDRTELFIDNAVNLLEEVSRKLLAGNPTVARRPRQVNDLAAAIGRRSA